MRRVLLTAIAVVVFVGGTGFGGSTVIPVPQQAHVVALEDDTPVSSILDGSVDDLGQAEPSEAQLPSDPGVVATASPTPPEDSSAPTPDALVPAPPAAHVSNILVVGSDLRTGEGNTGYGSVTGQRSDSTMLVQVNSLSGVTTVVSIPRDLWVRMPGCAGGGMDRFNAAFSRGGLDCTVKLVRSLTGLKLDHVAVLDFNAFKSAVETVGGVEVCLTRKVSDRYTGLKLPRGVSMLTPEQALMFARSRHSTATGSDLSRIDRQQYLFARLIDVARTKASDPAGAYGLVTALEPHLTVDDDFSAWDMVFTGLDVTRSKLVMKTLPYKSSSSVPWGTVAVDKRAAASLVRALQNPATDPPAPTGTASPAPSPLADASGPLKEGDRILGSTGTPVLCVD